MRTFSSFAALALLLGSGCGFDEGIWVGNMQGTVVIPFEAATGTYVNESGEEVTGPDRRFIGPVYLGLYPEVRDDIFAYPHPEVGPVFQAGIPGDTYPYGGTSVGDMRFACLKALQCRTVSNRFLDLDELVSWYNTVLPEQLVDASGNPVESGAYFRQLCYEMLNYTTDEELRLTAADRNEDGLIDEKDLDFQRNDEDQTFEATFTIYQQEYFSDPDGRGMSLWGWMDAPSESTYRFTTCDPNQGFQQNEYDADFEGGMQYGDLLNQPSQYIGAGDWVSSNAHVYSSPDETPVLTLDFAVEN